MTQTLLSDLYTVASWGMSLPSSSTTTTTVEGGSRTLGSVAYRSRTGEVVGLMPAWVIDAGTFSRGMYVRDAIEPTSIDVHQRCAVLSDHLAAHPRTELGCTTLDAIRPTWWDSAEASFQALRQLPENWNNYGAEPLDRQTIDRAVGVLATLVTSKTSEPSIVPAVMGGAQIEWHTLKGDLEIEFLPSGQISVLFSDARTGEELEPAEANLQSLRELVERVSD